MPKASSLLVLPGLSFRLDRPFFLEAGGFGAQAPHIEEAGPPDFTMPEQLNFFHPRGPEREGAFDAYSVGDPPYGKIASIAGVLDFNDHSLEYLYAFLFPFDNLGKNLDAVTGLKLGNIGIGFVNNKLFGFHVLNSSPVLADEPEY
jgi:hypothetical protein